MSLEIELNSAPTFFLQFHFKHFKTHSRQWLFHLFHSRFFRSTLNFRPLSISRSNRRPSQSAVKFRSKSTWCLAAEEVGSFQTASLFATLFFRMGRVFFFFVFFTWSICRPHPGNITFCSSSTSSFGEQPQPNGRTVFRYDDSGHIHEIRLTICLVSLAFYKEQPFAVKCVTGPFYSTCSPPALFCWLFFSEHTPQIPPFTFLSRAYLKFSEARSFAIPARHFLFVRLFFRLFVASRDRLSLPRFASSSFVRLQKCSLFAAGNSFVLFYFLLFLSSFIFVCRFV